MSSMNDNNPKTSAWGVKGLIAALVIAGAFLAFFYMAINSEPDYMPSKQKQVEQQEQLAQEKEKQTEESATPSAEKTDTK